jgi:Protein of unknown function (DUF2947)
MESVDNTLLPRWAHGLSASLLSRVIVLSESQAKAQWGRIDPQQIAFSSRRTHRNADSWLGNTKWELLVWWIDAYNSGQGQEDVGSKLESSLSWPSDKIVTLVWGPHKSLSISFGQFCKSWADIVEECDDEFFVLGDETDREVARFGPLGDVALSMLH